MAMSLNIHKLTDSFMENADADFQEEKSESRRGGRMPMVGVRSNHGRVLDLSPCGALVRPRRSLFGRKLSIGSEVVLSIRFDNVKFAVQAKVVRHEKVKGVGHVYGLAFQYISESQRKNIFHVAQSCRPKLMIAQDDAA